MIRQQAIDGRDRLYPTLQRISSLTGHKIIPNEPRHSSQLGRIGEQAERLLHRQEFCKDLRAVLVVDASNITLLESRLHTIANPVQLFLGLKCQIFTYAECRGCSTQFFGQLISQILPSVYIGRFAGQRLVPQIASDFESRIVKRLKVLSSRQVDIQPSIANDRCQLDGLMVDTESMLSKLDNAIAIA